MHRRGHVIVIAAALSLCAADSIGADQPSVPSTSQATPQAVHQAEILHHALEVRLIPDRHELLAVDQMTVRALADDVQEAIFTLHGHLQVVLVMEQRPAGAQPVSVQAEPATGSPGTGQVVTIRFNRPLNRDETVQLMWQYRGAINEPPREPRHLRFVTPSVTAGHIGTEGVYLSGETLWYPDLPGSLPTFAVRVKTPGEWTAVTHGRQRARMVQDAVAMADWEVTDKTEALTLVANRFVAKHRDWKGIEVAVYLFPDEAQLADEYLDASIRYLDAYIKILGPYPFPKFAVVENFFASGLGMPSFTLLGSGEIKRRYVQHDRLGHEVVHSWIGNSVLNEAGQGNWVEGLTTYLANYYYEELTGTPEQAREQRRKMLLGYAVYVRPEEDYPVAQFTQKKDQKDNAIGYQKAAMVFHMLRREIGEESFWRGLRTLVARYRSRHAGWKDVEQIFAETAGRELRWFFAQWVEQPGAPALAITQTAGRVRLMQGPRAYRVRVPLSVSLADGQEQSTSMQLTDAEGDPSIPSGARSVRLDPDYHAFRRIAREALPPMLNLFVTDRNRAVVMAGGGTETNRAPYVELAKQIAVREPGITSLDDREVQSATGSMLVLGGPGVNRAAEQAVLGCGNRVSLGGNSFTIEGKTYDGPGMALLVSCRDPDNPGRQATLFYGLSPQAATTVSRLLFFYGWQSYLVFQDGSVVARGDFPSRVNDLEVQIDVP